MFISKGAKDLPQGSIYFILYKNGDSDPLMDVCPSPPKHELIYGSIFIFIFYLYQLS